MKKQKSLVVLLSFFGNFPWYFDFFIQSCKNNPTIKFCIISDNKIILNCLPNNVFVYHQTINQFRNLASKRLGFTVSKIQGYKICDFRPCFACIYPELIKGYDFWGYGDIDVIFGDLRHFLTNQFLDRYDIFSFRPEYLTGSFTIYRNSKKINTLFKDSKDYQTVLSENEYFNFDECGFLFSPLHEGIPIENISSKIESMTHLVKTKASNGYLRAYFDFNLLEGCVGNIKWQNGKIIYKSQFEAILYHFLKFKDQYKNKKKIMPMLKNETIYISKKNIYKRK